MKLPAFVSMETVQSLKVASNEVALASHAAWIYKQCRRSYGYRVNGGQMQYGSILGEVYRVRGQHPNAFDATDLEQCAALNEQALELPEGAVVTYDECSCREVRR